MDTKKNNRSLLIGVIGLVAQVAGAFLAGFAASANNAGTPNVGLELFAWVLLVTGTVLLIWGMCLYAQAKEQSGWWGLLGIFGIIGLIVLSALPDRHDQRRRAQQRSPDISQPPDSDSVQFTCLSCGYMLNGVTSGACPECGRGFDPQNLSTVLVNDPNQHAKAPWTSRWSLICGLLGFATACVPLIGIVCPGLGVLFGHLALAKIKQSHLKTDRGVALIGLILSYITLMLGLFVNISIFLSVAGVI